MTKISELPVGTTTDGTEKVAVVQGGSTVRLPLSDLPVSTATQTALNLKANAASPAFTGTIDNGGGQIKFPATASASSDANTLDDYEEGLFTPTIVFATPGDVAITYSTQVGLYTKVGREVTVVIRIVTSAFTWTTASGAGSISGLPFVSANLTGNASVGNMTCTGITKATYTAFVPRVGQATTLAALLASGSGVANAAVNAADMPSGGAPNLAITITYFSD